MNYLMTGDHGTHFVGDQVEVTGKGNFLGFVVLEEAVVAKCESSGGDLLADMNILVSDSLPVGLYRPLSKKYITNFQLTSGKVNLVKAS